jgi:uridylate kinase
MTDVLPSSPGRILLKMSGEVLAGGSGWGIDTGTLAGMAHVLADLSASGWEVGVVTGGGNFVRGRDLQSVDRVTGDQMGMLATVINSLALRDAVEQLGGMAVVQSAFPVPGIVEEFSPRKAVSLLRTGAILIYAGGTGNPFLTTDTAAALRAVQTGCTLLLKGTKVDGVYDSDPVTNPSARRFSRLTFHDVLHRGLQVMDAAAVAVCRDAGLRICIFDIREALNIRRVLEDPTIGTIVWGGSDDD